MTDQPLPIPATSPAEALEIAAELAFPDHFFEAFDDDELQLFCVVTVVPEDPGPGELTVSAAAVADPNVEPDDELLFLFAAGVGDGQLEAQELFEGICDAIGVSNEQIRQFVDAFNNQ